MLPGQLRIGQPQILKSSALALGALLFAWLLAQWVLEGMFSGLTIQVLGVGVVAVALFALRNWQMGAYMALAWLVFEDLPRKFMGNNMAVYFAKDVLVAVVYIAFIVALRRRQTQAFQPPFLAPLLLFVGLGVVQVFNPNSTSIFYGLLGMKVYFYYIPLMFIGYALVRSQQDLDRFLSFSLCLGIIVSLVGVIQAVGWRDFLNPAHTAPEIQELSHLTRQSPLTHQELLAPPSVFVSTGRFGSFLILIFILALGAAGFQMMRGRRRAKLVYVALGAAAVGALVCGSRGVFVFCAASLIVLGLGFLQGAKFLSPVWARLIKAVRLTSVAVAICILGAIFFFPEALGASWSFYYDTLAPESPASELGFRTGQYPLQNLQQVFDYPDWALGYGTGTCSLGTQYVVRVLNRPAPPVPGTESGVGALILEMGILAPVLWVLWAGALVFSAWRVVRTLRGTAVYPVGLAILWYAFLLLFPMTYGGLPPYQNYILNAYLWILVGILFRLPDLAARRPQNGALRSWAVQGS